ncbi:hypothetical protein [Blackfly microvirus SF02]|uniref:Uncharacterized protein n=1 Tax=Blackfly microvirus SF02 TaxID=2576452 RepID=A0A4P8PK11_9VIRU|nr:hypothetical protein [Blackfly microvirus SF02]
MYLLLYNWNKLRLLGGGLNPILGLYCGLERIHQHLLLYLKLQSHAITSPAQNRASSKYWKTQNAQWSNASFLSSPQS